MTEEVLNSLTAERDQLLDDLLGSEEEQKAEILDRIMEIDDVIESLKSRLDYSQVNK